MLTTPLAILLSISTPLGQTDQSLRVMRATPQGSIERVDEIRVTFDRPVAASLRACGEGDLAADPILAKQ